MLKNVSIVVSVIVLAAVVVVAVRSGIFKEKSITATEASTTLIPLEFEIKAGKNLPAETTHADPF
jgi:hypothetical protein